MASSIRDELSLAIRGRHLLMDFGKQNQFAPKIKWRFREKCVACVEVREGWLWSCGDNKSPGPDGFTFEFFKKYWDCIGSDFCEAVEYFFVNSSFSKGCNSSFVALIPKVMDAKFVNDFRPISLIGSVYKVVTKVLANRLASVIADLISDTQSAFVAGRQILDGPFILDEILHWCKRKNKKAMFFKVDFAKAYDRFVGLLIDVLEAFGFWFWANVGVIGFRVLILLAKASILNMEVLLMSIIAILVSNKEILLLHISLS
ncbi:RNA-directed DNA polymerase, eukaryota [Tanacetum coccineum]